VLEFVVDLMAFLEVVVTRIVMCTMLFEFTLNINVRLHSGIFT